MATSQAQRPIPGARGGWPQVPCLGSRWRGRGTGCSLDGVAVAAAEASARLRGVPYEVDILVAVLSDILWIPVADLKVDRRRCTAIDELVAIPAAGGKAGTRTRRQA